jgi:hypothetical protein
LHGLEEHSSEKIAVEYRGAYRLAAVVDSRRIIVSLPTRKHCPAQGEHIGVQEEDTGVKGLPFCSNSWSRLAAVRNDGARELWNKFRDKRDNPAKVRRTLRLSCFASQQSSDSTTRKYCGLSHWRATAMERLREGASCDGSSDLNYRTHAKQPSSNAGLDMNG